MRAFPKLCYIGPPIAATVGGPALIYKLLVGYPPERLLFVEVGENGNGWTGYLAGVETITIPVPPSWIGPRCRTLYELSFLYLKSCWGRWLERHIEAFRPDAVVSVIHGWVWEVGLYVCRRRGIPFHAVLHDHADIALPAPKALRSLRQGRWKQLCDQASSRLCVSPFMVEEVQRVTGTNADVLYPGLAPGAELALWCPKQNPAKGKSLCFSFVGSIHDEGYAHLLLRAGRILAAEGHRLVVHSPHASRLLQDEAAEGICDGGLIPVDVVAEKLKHEADVLVLPMSFRPEDERNMRVSFPSKLVEYCAAGRPVLIWGPHYCSAVRWAKEHPGFAAVVNTDSDEAMLEALKSLGDSAIRERLGRRSLELAREYFSHEHTFGKFLEVLNRASSV